MAGNAIDGLELFHEIVDTFELENLALDVRHGCFLHAATIAMGRSQDQGDHLCSSSCVQVEGARYVNGTISSQEALGL